MKFEIPDNLIKAYTLEESQRTRREHLCERRELLIEELKQLDNEIDRIHVPEFGSKLEYEVLENIKKQIKENK